MPGLVGVHPRAAAFDLGGLAHSTNRWRATFASSTQSELTRVPRHRECEAPREARDARAIGLSRFAAMSGRARTFFANDSGQGKFIFETPPAFAFYIRFSSSGRKNLNGKFSWEYLFK
jgi:hypothetical protein